MPGSISEISLNGRSFKATADGDGATNLGGMSNELQMNGDGETARLKQTRTAWKFSGLDIAIDDENEDQEFIQDLQGNGKPFPIKVTYSDGTVRSGKGSVIGDIESSSMNGTASIELSGPGKFKKQ